MNKKHLTKEQVNKQYHGKYIEIYPTYDYTERRTFYDVGKVYTTNHENTTLGQDVGTNLEYCR